MSAAPKFREFEFGITRAVKTERDGSVYLRAEQALQAYPERMTDRLIHWAKERPDQSWIAQRQRRSQHDGDANGQWVHITYAEAWQKA